MAASVNHIFVLPDYRAFASYQGKAQQCCRLWRPPIVMIQSTSARKPGMGGLQRIAMLPTDFVHVTVPHGMVRRPRCPRLLGKIEWRPAFRRRHDAQDSQPGAIKNLVTGQLIEVA
jgi:hypothetical protein